MWYDYFVSKDQLNKAYKELAAKLGDIQYKRRVLDARESILFKQIDVLNKAMEKLKNETKDPKV